MVDENEIVSLGESVVPRNASDFTRARSVKGNRDDKESLSKIAFYKLLMTMSNMHSTVSDTYLLNDNTGRAGYHMELSVRFRNEANKVKNS
jgi:hypothetical protein